MKKTEVNIELNVHELDIILKALELVESIDEIQINRSSGSIDTLYDRLYDYYSTLDTSNVELNYESYVDQSF
jgi:dimeric dUTPase (all-alpha-NTP-PPase superfamily)